MTSPNSKPAMMKQAEHFPSREDLRLLPLRKKQKKNLFV
jgi:hypothetical protein